MNDYYVYVYIDPRNFEDFYYGKGKGSRKSAHLSDDSDSEKSRRIVQIRKAGLEPIIRVIARNLTEHDALLVEKTLLWKLGRTLTNVSSGHYADRFRPHNTLHQELIGFDYRCGIYYYNVGEKGGHRNWDDYVEFGFISGGQGHRWRDAMLGFNEGDIVVAYLARHGFVGIGQILARARPVREVVIAGKPLLSSGIRSNGMNDNVESDADCEYVATVDWLKTVDRKNAKWKPRSGLYTSQLVRASLNGQPETMKFLEQTFGIGLHNLVV